MILLCKKGPRGVGVRGKQRSILLPNRLESWTLKNHVQFICNSHTTTMRADPTGSGNTLAQSNTAENNWQLMRARKTLQEDFADMKRMMSTLTWLSWLPVASQEAEVLMVCLTRFDPQIESVASDLQVTAETVPSKKSSSALPWCIAPVGCSYRRTGLPFGHGRNVASLGLFCARAGTTAS